MRLAAQDARIGVAMPVTLTGEMMTTHRLQTFDPETRNVVLAARGMFYPTLKLGQSWYGYSAIQLKSEPYYYYETYYPRRGVDAALLQAFVGYSRYSEGTAMSFKVGELPVAFGSYPLRYDDAANPLLDVPLNYGSYIGLRGDRLPCDVADLLRQRSYGFIRFFCGGETSNKYGLWLVSLYGVPAAEVNFSLSKLDTRFQLANSSPANPQSLRSGSQHVQWTAGAGYTVRQGFRVGFSAFRGPYLEEEVEKLLPEGNSVRDYPAIGLGLDIQWAGGRWNANGEWQWHQFQYPGFRTSPAVHSGYIELKTILNPRFYAAVRVSSRRHNQPEDLIRKSDRPFQANLQAYEFAVGYHVTHFQTLKVGYEWVRTNGISGNRNNVLGVQFVTSINSLAKAIQ
jgi:hypothetical protein